MAPSCDSDKLPGRPVEQMTSRPTVCRSRSESPSSSAPDSRISMPRACSVLGRPRMEQISRGVGSPSKLISEMGETRNGRRNQRRGSGQGRVWRDGAGEWGGIEFTVGAVIVVRKWAGGEIRWGVKGGACGGMRIGIRGGTMAKARGRRSGRGRHSDRARHSGKSTANARNRRWIRKMPSDGGRTSARGKVRGICMSMRKSR